MSHLKVCGILDLSSHIWPLLYLVSRYRDIYINNIIIYNKRKRWFINHRIRKKLDVDRRIARGTYRVE